MNLLAISSIIVGHEMYQVLPLENLKKVVGTKKDTNYLYILQDQISRKIRHKYNIRQKSSLCIVLTLQRRPRCV